MKRLIIIFSLLLIPQLLFAVGETSYIEGVSIEQRTPFYTIFGGSPEISDTSIDNLQYYNIDKIAIVAPHPNNSDFILSDSAILWVQTSNFRINEDTVYIYLNSQYYGEYSITDTNIYIPITGFNINQQNKIEVIKWKNWITPPYTDFIVDVRDTTYRFILPYYYSSLPQDKYIEGISIEQYKKTYVESIDGVSAEYFVSIAPPEFQFDLTQYISDYSRYKKIWELYPQLSGVSGFKF
ncbi:MAG TPA: hypothetical protein PLW02_12525, partial [Verrucomicrobiota bacterium]|nr:hypothetical protein [Verrucomicrobiota bacterium]